MDGTFLPKSMRKKNNFPECCYQSENGFTIGAKRCPGFQKWKMRSKHSPHINSVPLLPSSGLKIRCPSKVLSSCKYDRCSSKMYETEQYFSPQTFPFPKGEELKLVLLYLSVVLKSESWGVVNKPRASWKCL